MRYLAALLAALTPTLVCASEILVAARTLPAGTIIAAGDLQLRESDRPGLGDHDEVLGLETRITIYAGRRISGSMLVAPVLVRRNQIVPLVFRRGALEIAAEGRALSEAASGDSIRIMNTDNRSTVTARILPDGTALATN